MEIRGLPIPPLLEKFLNNGVWNNKRSITIPRAMLDPLGIKYDVQVRLYDLETFKAENTEESLNPNYTDDGYKLIEFMAARASSKREGKPITDPKKLDMDKALVIASEWSDDIICLDYRFDVNNPPVMVMDWAKKEWAVLAPNFDVFAKGIGLLG
jgi:hypothetical protein